jgi:anti-anti-sigma regulatory factor/DNA-directed RNA polymerase subunit RPC12/RpoP
MNVKNLLLGATTLIFLAAIALWLTGAISKSKQEEARGGDGGQAFMVCPECGLRLPATADQAKNGVACPHCVDKGIKMVKEAKVFRGASSGLGYYSQMFALGLIGADAIMLGLCYYFYFHRPSAINRKLRTTYLNCTCPTCHRKYKFKKSQVGQPYQCNNCRRNFVFPDPEARIPPKVIIPAKVRSAPARPALLPGQEPPQDINRKKFYLIVANGEKRGLPIRVNDDLFLVGREKECQLRTNQPGIAPRHFSLVTRLNKVFVRDWDSGQPTMVNGELLPPGQEWPVHAGDRIGAGMMELVVQFRESSLSQQDLEEWALKCLDADEKRDEFNEYQATGYSERLERASDVAAQVIAKLMDHKGVEEGRLRIFEQGDILIIRFNDARLVEESEIALVRKEIQDHVERSGMRILLDFKNVKRLSTAAVEMLADLYRWLAGQGSRLALCRLAPELQWLLGTLNAIQPVKHYEEKLAALNSSW